MTRISATQEPYLVFNTFDKHGLLLDLPRLTRERNPAYKQRIMDVFVNRADSTYRGLINGITRELGLQIKDTISIAPVLDGSGSPLLANPAVKFLDTKCYLYSDYVQGTVLSTIDRFSPTDSAYTVSGLISVINATGYFTATLLDSTFSNKRSMTIFNQSSVELVEVEDITGSGSVIVLDHNNLIEGSVTVVSSTLTTRVASEAALTRPGTYTVSLADGTIVANGVPSDGSFVRYSYRNDSFVAKSSPVIIHNLQSDDFRNQMFENTGEGNTNNHGLPTKLGADIINELLSVYPTNWGQ